ncbi:DUF3021 domain-containing protein [Amphibacillus jilinensis]|uniref:DUF3021 domain-containing protein n=1 Tax=Amphibacillus jilinensis TaxID=1216008 RepID=UPI0002DB0993|nr:DUF3021 domain-containing protein [Amphibacillus jilinensis]
MNEIIKRIWVGFGFASVLTFVALSLIVLQQVDTSVYEVWQHMLGSLVMGAYFGVASFIFEQERWSPLIQTVAHFSLSILVWLPLALFLGWVPLGWWTIIIGVFSFTVVYCLFWLGSTLYFKSVLKQLNQMVK